MKAGEKGFTLIELMVTLAVAIVVLAVGIPAFSLFSARDSSAATVNALVMALQLARGEALVGRQTITVCGCTVKDCGSGTKCGAGASWANGWMVTADPSGSTPPLRVFSALRGEMTLAVVGADPLAFDHLGMPPLTGSPGTRQGSTVTVTAYTSKAHQTCARITDVVVSLVGQVRSDVKACP